MARLLGRERNPCQQTPPGVRPSLDRLHHQAGRHPFKTGGASAPPVWDVAVGSGEGGRHRPWPLKGRRGSPAPELANIGHLSDGQDPHPPQAGQRRA